MPAVYEDILAVAMEVCDGYLAYRLIGTFLTPKAHYRFARYEVWVFMTTLSLVCYLLINNGAFPLSILCKLIIILGGLLIFSICRYKGGLMQKIFPVLLFMAARELAIQTSNAMTGINSWLLDVLIYLADNEILITYENCINVMNVLLTVTMTLITAVRELIVYLFQRGITLNYKHKIHTEKEAAAYMLPSAVALMFCAMMRIIIIYVDELGYTTSIFTYYPWLYLLVPLTSAALIAAIFYSFRLNQNLAELGRGQADRAILENQINHMQSALAEKERLYDSVRSIRHDMNNSMSVLKSMLKQKYPDDEEINRYFDGMCLSAEPGGGADTGNIVSDTVIDGKFALARRGIKDIRLCADDFIFTGDLGLEPYDIGVILSNGLDNAIEACEKLKKKSPDAAAYITLRSFKKKNMFFAEIENSYDGTLTTDSDGFPVTDKENDELHGIGLRNIKSCAEKYAGGMDLSADGKKFVLTVMMKVR